MDYSFSQEEIDVLNFLRIDKPRIEWICNYVNISTSGLMRALMLKPYRTWIIRSPELTLVATASITVAYYLFKNKVLLPAPGTISLSELYDKLSKKEKVDESITLFKPDEDSEDHVKAYKAWVITHFENVRKRFETLYIYLKMHARIDFLIPQICIYANKYIDFIELMLRLIDKPDVFEKVIKREMRKIIPDHILDYHFENNEKLLQEFLKK